MSGTEKRLGCGETLFCKIQGPNFLSLPTCEIKRSGTGRGRTTPLPAQTDDARGHFGNGPVEKESEEETFIGARRHSGMAARKAEQITANGRFMLPGKEGEAPNEAEGGHAMIGREGENKRVGNRVQCHPLNVTPTDQNRLNSRLLHGE